MEEKEEIERLRAKVAELETRLAVLRGALKWIASGPIPGVDHRHMRSHAQEALVREKMIEEGEYYGRN